MTTPPDEPATNPTDETAAIPAQPAAQAPAPAPVQAPVQAPPYAYATPGPFTPVPRAPWINPAKRTQVAVVSAVTAVVLAGGGLAIGYAAGDHHDNNPTRQVRFMPGDRDGRGPGFQQFPGQGNGPNRMFPGGPNQPTPSPSPSQSG